MANFNNFIAKMHSVYSKEIEKQIEKCKISESKENDKKKKTQKEK